MRKGIPAPPSGAERIREAGTEAGIENHAVREKRRAFLAYRAHGHRREAEADTPEAFPNGSQSARGSVITNITTRNIRSWGAALKALVPCISIGLLLSAPRTYAAPPKNPNEVMVGVGMAGSYVSPYRRAPTVSILYLRKFQWVLGNHVEAVFGLGESVWGASYQLDAWLNENVRIGALSHSGGATLNLIYGARAFAGLGYPF